ncbi:DUF1772 domain-containing protein [Nitratireductor thuwali]|uniref:DUF1772 domain-containing protein n=1 Tax=Nitratireductor thuwali TaxID=2267699 RepID=A0ABY5MFH2_9HYPH|nr:hypothetical protein NTH_00097 [Nitratireductor thuwali]
MQTLITALLWFSAIGCGLIAGLYFAFSTFIMTALDRIGHAQGAAAMNSINSTILGSLFMPLFFGTTAAAALLALLGLVRWSEPGAMVMLAGGLVYVVGMFLCTVVYNVPLNNELARVGSGAADAWARYLKDWTFWNHVRTVASTAAMALFIVALLARHSTSP